MRRLILVSLFLVGCAKTVKELQRTESKNFALNSSGRMLFVLAGDSIMSGRDQGPSTVAQDPRVWLYGNDHKWKEAYEPTDDGTGQIDIPTGDWGAGISPGLAFANELLKEIPQREIALIPCARGGTTVTSWLNGGPMGDCRAKIQEASSKGSLVGVLFALGTNDAVYGHPNWCSDYKALVSQFGSMPSVLALVSKDVDPIQFPYAADIRAQQLACDVPKIDVNDIRLFDHVHPDAAGSEELGRRMARQWLSDSGFYN